MRASYEVMVVVVAEHSVRRVVTANFSIPLAAASSYACFLFKIKLVEISVMHVIVFWGVL